MSSGSVSGSVSTEPSWVALRLLFDGICKYVSIVNSY